MWTISINSAINDGRTALYDESCSSTLASTFSNGRKRNPEAGVVSYFNFINYEHIHLRSKTVFFSCFYVYLWPLTVFKDVLPFIGFLLSLDLEVTKKLPDSYENLRLKQRKTSWQNAIFTFMLILFLLMHKAVGTLLIY